MQRPRMHRQAVQRKPGAWQKFSESTKNCRLSRKEKRCWKESNRPHFLRHGVFTSSYFTLWSPLPRGTSFGQRKCLHTASEGTPPV